MTTTFTADTTAAALLRAILIDPTDTDARLVYADALTDIGDDVRADYIRTAIATARHKGCGQFMYACGEFLSLTELAVQGCEDCQSYARLCLRENDLIEPGLLHRFPGPFWRADNEYGWTYATGHGVAAGVRDGFVSSVALTTDLFVKHAESLFLAWPIEEVRLTDRNPSIDTGNPSELVTQWWYPVLEDCSEIGWQPYFLPYRLRPFLVRERPEEDRRISGAHGFLDGTHFMYTSARSAWAALSAACVAYGRSLRDAAWKRQEEGREDVTDAY